jgi:predicted AAA+ superfamily ATPase
MSGPKSAGKTILSRAIKKEFHRLHKEGKIKANRLEIREHNEENQD